MSTIKSLVKEKQSIVNAKQKISLREKKLHQRLLKEGKGHYIVDGELWEIKVEYFGRMDSAQLIFKGQVIQESE